MTKNLSELIESENDMLKYEYIEMVKAGKDETDLNQYFIHAINDTNQN